MVVGCASLGARLIGHWRQACRSRTRASFKSSRPPEQTAVTAAHVSIVVIDRSVTD
jgi:hypothetical protein